jgi:CDP-diacylglycerol--glycerol-3-phosphate 3-phosphatidyltransferase
MRAIPNLLTLARIALALMMFASLVVIGAGERGVPVPIEVRVGLAWFSVAAFVIAGLTDFLDGWMARRWGATSLAGAILDPIADKVLVCAAIVGLLAVGMPDLFVFAAFGGLILFREFSISALREVLAPRGIRLPTTFLAKTKTTLQLVALGAVMILDFWPVWRIDMGIAALQKAWSVAEVLLALATIVTLWTGVQYAREAARALRT